MILMVTALHSLHRCILRKWCIIRKRQKREKEREYPCGLRQEQALAIKAIKPYLDKFSGFFIEEINTTQAMKNILKNGTVELSNNLAEQMMRHIKINLKNCLNIATLFVLLLCSLKLNLLFSSI